MGENIINLSNVQLSEHQVRALEKGLTFCPSRGYPGKYKIWDDFKEFHRRLEFTQFLKAPITKIMSICYKALLTS